MAYDVRHVRNRRGLRDFIELPFRLYRDNPHWVPPLRRELRRTLDPAKNPYFTTASVDLLVCYRDGTPVARTALVISDAHCRRFNVHTGFFGFFEAEDDTQAVLDLFTHVESLCAARTIDTLEGPFNPNHYSELGMLADCYEEDQAFFQTYNPPYYHALLAAARFSPAEALFTARNSDVKGFLSGEPDAAVPVNSGEDYMAREFRMGDFREELEKVRGVFNDAFSGNWHFLPAEREEHLFAAKYLAMVTDPSLVTIVEHRGEPVGVLMCVLDVNPLLKELGGRVGPISTLRFLRGRRRIGTLVVYAVGIRKAYQRSRVYALLVQSMRRMARRFDVLECTWMSPGNVLALAAARRMGMKEHKHFLIYRRQFSTRMQRMRREEL